MTLLTAIKYGASTVEQRGLKVCFSDGEDKNTKENAC